MYLHPTFAVTLAREPLMVLTRRSMESTKQRSNRPSAIWQPTCSRRSAK
ncbi:MAG: hypothetical protein LJE61_01720 [Thiocapsa sp.]|jgi:hypothetical protein|nr:hypothetical protein [Thiocapsa sp.]MCG6983906.1 hypothetical protein [Thiocapsa sp.]